MKWLLAAAIAVLGIVYGVAWAGPAFGLYHDDAIYLVTARALVAGHGYTIESLPAPLAQTKYPPLWPALLAILSLVSSNIYWLKLGAIGCFAAWLALTRRLLLKMGASQAASLVIIGLTAAAPTTVFLASNLMSEMLFSLLVTATLLFLLEERCALAGLLAGMAFLTRTAGAPLIPACVLVLLFRRRVWGGAKFTAVAAVVATPWLAWTAWYSAQDRYYSGANYVVQNVVTGLQPSEKLAVVFNNLLFLFASPFALLTNQRSTWTVFGTLGLLGWCLYRRRQALPDLFVSLYAVTIVLWAWPPQRFVAPILPLILWMVWRAARTLKNRERVVAGVILLAGLTLYATLNQLPITLRSGQFPSSTQPPNDWKQMQKMFDWVRQNTPEDTVIMANLDPLWYLQTGRKATRGFTPDPFRTFYSPGATPVTAAEMAAWLLRTHAGYVVMSPDRDFGEAAAYNKAVEALERGGLLEPVDGVGLARSYRLLKATGASSLR